MKNLLLAGGMSLVISASFAQGKDLTSAAMAHQGAQPLMMQAMQSGDFSKAKGKIMKSREYIDAAYDKQLETNALKAKDIPKMWRYRSEIYMSYSMLAGTDEEIKKEVEKDAEMFQEAIFGSARKCKETDPKGTHFKPLKAKLNMLRYQSATMGISMFNDGKYEESYELFSGAAEIADVIDFVDTVSNYNAGLSAEKIEKYEEAAKYYKYCTDKGYNGALTYVLLSQSLGKAGKGEEAQKELAAGLEKYPGNMDLVKEQLNSYLIAEEFDKAEVAMNKIIEKEPNNPILHFSIGTIFDNLKKYDEAEKSYDKALALDANYFDALYGKGASYFNQGVALNEEIKTISDMVLEQKKTKEAEAFFAKAMPVLEKAHTVNAEDRSTMIALKQIYGRLGLDDKWSEMKEKLNN